MTRYDKRKLIILTTIAFVGILLLIALSNKPTYTSDYVPISFDDEPTYFEPTPIPDWTLEIPEINFSQQMEEIHTIGKEIPVPDNNPGYLITNDHNTFIVGHNNTTFQRLKEIPHTINIYHDNQPQSYTLVKHETLNVADISMKRLLDFSGIVIMTCAGDYVDEHYTQRLIVYYK